MQAQNRIEVVLDMMAALARLGAKNEKLVIHVGREEWGRWLKDSATAHKLVEQRHDPHLLDIYGFNGLVVTIRCSP